MIVMIMMAIKCSVRAKQLHNSHELFKKYGLLLSVIEYCIVVTDVTAAAVVVAVAVVVVLASYGV